MTIPFYFCRNRGKIETNANFAMLSWTYPRRMMHKTIELFKKAHIGYPIRAYATPILSCKQMIPHLQHFQHKFCKNLHNKWRSAHTFLRILSSYYVYTSCRSYRLLLSMQTNGTKARLFVKIWFTEEPPSRSGIEHANREKGEWKWNKTN